MRYIAFFRGINVGGKHKVKMADLRQLFADLGFVFAERFGFAGEVIVRSAQALSAIASGLPFTAGEVAQAEAAAPDVAHVYICLSGAAIRPDDVQVLQRSYEGSDRLIAGERKIYPLCFDSVCNSNLAVALAKQIHALTARNLKTLRALLPMANAPLQA